MVRAGPESLVPIPDPVAKPQLLEGYVSPPPPSLSPHIPAPCQAWPPPKDPSLPNSVSGALPGSQLPVLGFFFLSASLVSPPKIQAPSRLRWPYAVPLGVPPHIGQRRLLCGTTEIPPSAHRRGRPFRYQSLLTQA